MSNVTAYQESHLESMDHAIEDYLPLVKKIALHLLGRLPKEVELDDLLQVGVIGLIQARESFDATKGASFETFAGIRIKGAMIDELRRFDWTPRSVQQKVKLVSETIRKIENQNGRAANDREIAQELAISLEEYYDISRELVGCRLSSIEESELEIEDCGSDPFNRIANDEFRHSLKSVIKTLPQKEQLVMSLYYGEELNLKEIAEVLGVTESRVSQIHGQTLARIRARMEEWNDSRELAYGE